VCAGPVTHLVIGYSVVRDELLDLSRAEHPAHIADDLDVVSRGLRVARQGRICSLSALA
jgi:hypothetical protein